MTWIGIALGFQTIMGAIVTGIFTYLNSRVTRDRERDKMEFDAKVIQLESERESDLERNAECEKQHAIVLGKLEKCEEMHERTDARLDDLEKRLRPPAPGSGVHRPKRPGGPQPDGR